MVFLQGRKKKRVSGKKALNIGLVSIKAVEVQCVCSTLLKP